MATKRNMSEKLSELTGQPVAFLCARYWYRGMLQEVGDDFVTLTHAYAVESTGPANQASAVTEDPIPSDLTIALGALEQICQPLWVWKDMPIENPNAAKEDKKKSKR